MGVGSVCKRGPDTMPSVDLLEGRLLYGLFYGIKEISRHFQLPGTSYD